LISTCLLYLLVFSYSRAMTKWFSYSVDLIFFKKSRGFSDDDYYWLSLLLDFVKIISENDSWHSWFPQWYKVKICFVFWSLKIMFFLLRNSYVARNFLTGYPPAGISVHLSRNFCFPRWVPLHLGHPPPSPGWTRAEWSILEMIMRYCFFNSSATSLIQQLADKIEVKSVNIHAI